MDNTVNTPVSTVSTTPAPATDIRPITISGKKVAFKALVNSRGKGEDKGAPVLLPKYATDNSPSFSEIVALATVIGDGFLAKAVDTEVIRPLFLAASKDARTKNADGSWVIDDGKFSGRAVDLLREWCSSQSAKKQIEDDLAEVAQQIAAITGRMISLSMEGKLIPQDEVNRANQLLLKKAELENKLQKKTRKPAAPAAATK